MFWKRYKSKIIYMWLSSSGCETRRSYPAYRALKHAVTNH